MSYSNSSNIIAIGVKNATIFCETIVSSGISDPDAAVQDAKNDTFENAVAF